MKDTIYTKVQLFDTIHHVDTLYTKIIINDTIKPDVYKMFEKSIDSQAMTTNSILWAIAIIVSALVLIMGLFNFMGARRLFKIDAKKISKKQTSILKEQNKNDIDTLKNHNKADLDKLKTSNSEELDVLKNQTKADLDKLKTSNSEELDVLKNQNKADLDKLKEDNAREVKEHRIQNMKNLTILRARNTREINNLKNQINKDLEDLKRESNQEMKFLKEYSKHLTFFSSGMLFHEQNNYITALGSFFSSLKVILNTNYIDSINRALKNVKIIASIIVHKEDFMDSNKVFNYDDFIKILKNEKIKDDKWIKEIISNLDVIKKKLIIPE